MFFLIPSKLFKKFKKRLQAFTFSDWLVIGLIAIGGFLRFYNLENSQQFIGDQGRDSIVVSRIFKEHDLVFIGPVTSLGNMYLGPLYYYFMLPFLLLSYPSPMGPIYAVALLGTITIGILYWVGKRMFSIRVALIATTLFTFSSVSVMFTRFSWNPNPAPLPALLLMYFVFQAWKKSSKYWILATLMLCILLQLHYVTLLMGGTIGVFWIADFFRKYKNRTKEVGALKKLLTNTLLSALVALISFAPLILFDLKHDGLNLKAFRDIFVVESAFGSNSKPSLSKKLVAILDTLVDRSKQMALEIYFGKVVYAPLFLGILGALSAFVLYFNKKSKSFIPTLIIMITIAISLVGLTFFKGAVYDHYITFIFPAVFLLFGVLLDFLIKKWRFLGLVVTLLFLALFLRFNLNNMPIQDAGWKIEDIRRTAESISERVKPGDVYNIVLLSETKDIYGQNYRYFLSTVKGKEPINPEYPADVNKLFIIDEQRLEEKVTDSPIYQIVVFPNKEPTEIYDITGGPRIYVLETK